MGNRETTAYVSHFIFSIDIPPLGFTAHVYKISEENIANEYKMSS